MNTQDHECDRDACCSACNQLLPWALYEIRGLDGEHISDLD